MSSLDCNTNCSSCGNRTRVNKLGRRKGFCIECAKEKRLWEPGDRPDGEPEGFTEFWSLVSLPEIEEPRNILAKGL
jgi:hypothetical protein